jgi:hypothetical protein
MPIRHSESEDRPRAGSRYRCHLCRIELVLDVKTNRLAAVPAHDDERDSDRQR